MNGQAAVNIPLIFLGQGIPVVLQVSQQENWRLFSVSLRKLPPLLKQPGPLRRGFFGYPLPALRCGGSEGIETVIKPAEEGEEV